MTIIPPKQSYAKLINYGREKAASKDRHIILQAMFAGVLLGIVAHCCTAAGGSFVVVDPQTKEVSNVGAASLVYAVFFVGAFVAIMLTGAELFTGNTMTITTLALEEGWKKRGRDFFRIYGYSLFFNLIGCVVVAACSKGTGQFNEGTSGYYYLTALVQKKIHHKWWESLLLGIGCNTLVSLATWYCSDCEDGGGRVLAMFYSIAVFAIGGLEHSIANAYTLPLGMMANVEGWTWKGVMLNNWIPVLVGNIMGGAMVCSVVWWYTYGTPNVLETYSDAVLEDELVKRASFRQSSRMMAGEQSLPGAAGSLKQPTNNPLFN